MNANNKSWPAETFEGLYSKSPDPWGFASRGYERRKYRDTLAALPHCRYTSAFEVGCSVGVLTRLLARRCDQLLAVDASGTAVDRARQRCSALRHVCCCQMYVPATWPNRPFDLIVLSEILYFLSSRDVRETARRCIVSLRPKGIIILVNWTGRTNTPCGGDAAAEQFIHDCRSRLRPGARHRRPGYRLDLLC